MEEAGIISLVSDENVYFVIDGGRVSLANLIDFSHFVDLYVLEDNVYVSEFAKDGTLKQVTQNNNSPVKSIDYLSTLGHLVNHIADKTLEIYDFAPTNYTFSLDSYEYWTKLSVEERAAISDDIEYGKPGTHTREELLGASKELDVSIAEIIKEISLTKLRLMPSPRNLLPFLDNFRQWDTPATLLYREVSKTHREKVEEVLKLTTPSTIYLPPLLTILLSRCNSQDDIPARLVELREEYIDFRKSTLQWFKRLDDAKSLKDKLMIREEIDSFAKKVSAKFENRRPAFYKEMLGVIMDAAEDGNVQKAIVKPTFAILKKGLTEWLPDLFTTKRFTGLVDLMNESLQIENYGNLLPKVFCNTLDISSQELSEARAYRRVIIDAYDIPLPTPG